MAQTALEMNQGRRMQGRLMGVKSANALLKGGHASPGAAVLERVGGHATEGRA
jgi:hypothetical protein